MRKARQIADFLRITNGADSFPPEESDPSDSPDPNDSDLLRDRLKGETVEHAKPARLEDEGQSGG